MTNEERMAQLTAALSMAAPAANTQQTDYQTVRQLFQGAAMNPAVGTGGVGGMLGAGLAGLTQGTRPFTNYVTAPGGQMLYQDSGVIADPSTQSVLFPTHKPGVDDIEGSEEWLRTIQSKWSDDEFDKWRKRLVSLGYDTLVSGGIAESGGAAMDVIEGLRQYHRSRYLNGGKPLTVVPKSGRSIRETVRSSFDPEAVKEEVKAWGAVPFEEELDDDLADYFADRTMQLAVKLAKEHKDWSLEQVQQGATLRAQKEFVNTPGVKGALKDAEDDEMDESLRNTVVSVSQLGSI